MVSKLGGNGQLPVAIGVGKSLQDDFYVCESEQQHHVTRGRKIVGVHVQVSHTVSEYQLQCMASHTMYCTTLLFQ